MGTQTEDIWPDLNERQRRAQVLRAKATHMNNTKWREVFNLLRDRGVDHVFIKWVGQNDFVQVGVPDADEMQRATFGCFHPLYDYADINCLEIDAASSPATIEGDLATLGQLPLTSTDRGWRLTAYTW